MNNKALEGKGFLRLFMPPMSSDELQACASIWRQGATAQAVPCYYKRWGGSARMMFCALRDDPKLAIKEAQRRNALELDSSIFRIGSAADFSAQAREAEFLGADCDDMVFHLKPHSGYQSYEVVFASETVAERVRYRLWDLDPVGTAAFIGRAYDDSMVRGIAAYLLEPLAAHFLCCKKGPLWATSLAAGRERVRINLAPKETRVVDQKLLAGAALDKGVLYRRSTSASAGITSSITGTGDVQFLAAPNMVFQVTLAAEHPVSVESMLDIVSTGPLKKEDTVRLVFMAPEGVFYWPSCEWSMSRTFPQQPWLHDPSHNKKMRAQDEAALAHVQQLGIAVPMGDDYVRDAHKWIREWLKPE